MGTNAGGKKNFGKWFAIGLAALLVLSVGIGITLATVFKNTEDRANNFTFGNLSIELIETEWDKLTPEDRVTYPGRVIVKDPKIKNTGITDAYMYVTVGIPRDVINTVNADQTINRPKAATDLFTFTVNSGWTQIGSGTVSDDGKYQYYTYAYTAGIIKQDEETGTLFDEVTFVNALEGQPEMGTELSIQISATGIQSGYLGETGNTLAEKICNAYTLAQD